MYETDLITLKACSRRRSQIAVDKFVSEEFSWFSDNRLETDCLHGALSLMQKKGLSFHGNEYHFSLFGATLHNTFFFFTFFRYVQVPRVMEKRQAYEKGGNKLHIYNDHVFTAVHFAGR